ncbi:armadillo-type protein [Suillus occidentalis]|nr:armadillo-type protein [Suillus occidentalis]
MEKFETISDQIIDWVNKSVNEEDGETIIQVIRLIFEHATDEPAWSDMHAKKGTAEAELYLGEYYNAAQEGTHQYLGLIKFISELFKLQMLKGCIMHEFVKKLLGNIENLVEEKLLGNVENLVEEKIESLCQLLKTVGQSLDTPKACAHMDVYFTRMKVLCKSHNFSARMQFMLQDVFELRDRRWASRNVAAAPIVFAAVYEAANYRHLRISCGGRRLGSERKHEDGQDSGAISGGLPARTPKDGGLLQFGKINNGAPIASVMGRNSLFMGRKKDSKRETPPQRNLDSGGFDLSNIAPISGAGFGPVAPLKLSANRWVPTSATSNVRPHVDSPEVVYRKVKALLNKLTTQRFDLISDQIIQWVNKSVNKEGRTLIRVIRLVFEHASDGAVWSKLYARLCWKMMEQINMEVQDDGIKNAEGKPITSGQLFRKYLLNHCQEDLERGWFAKKATAAAAAAKVSDDHATKAANDKKGTEEAELYSEEYHAAQNLKRLGLGLTMFLGELFKRQMITECIIHECVRKLLCNVEHSEQEELESLCQLLQMVGQLLDTRKARAQMNVYFMRMKELSKGLDVSFRMQFMLQDVVELRDRKWIRRNAVAAPTTVVAVHEVTPHSSAFPGAVLNVQTRSRPGIDIQPLIPSMRPTQQHADTPSSTKSPTSLPSQSAWVKGAPQSSSSSFASPNSSSHSRRRPRVLGLGVSVRDGVSVPRNNVRSVVQPGSVIFGSIDNASVSLSSSPSAISAVKAAVVQSFGSVPATSSGFADCITLASALAAASSKQFSKPSSSSTPSKSRIPS